MSTCGRCHKPLADDLSVARGYGPECWALVQLDRQIKEEHLGGELGAFNDELILQRGPDGSAQTNVVHRKIWHSPTGFEWGYGGSGPADLALNVLLYFVGENEAVALHQHFKWEFLANAPKEGLRMPRHQIQEWINQKLGALPLGV